MKVHTHDVRSRVEFDAVKRSGIKLEPQPGGSYKNSPAEGIEWFEFDPVSIDADIAAEGLPTKLRVLDKVSGGIRRYTKEVRPIVAGVGIPPHVLRKRMECRAGKSFLIDIAQTAHRSTIPHAQQVKICRVISKS
jgi:hypothetical protein